MRFEKTGDVYITKAHANAKSAYIVKLAIDKNKHQVKVQPELKYLNENIPFDSATNAVVQKWSAIAEKSYASIGFNANKVVIPAGEALDGRESVIRSKPSNLTRLITAAVANACPMADVAIVNSGSIRVDDVLVPPISQYDILRAMPFGGGIREVDMKGSLLQQVILAGEKNAGSGGYLLTQPINITNNTVAVKGVPIDLNRTYRVALTDFLLSGKEANLDFLNVNNPGITRVYDAEVAPGNPKSDIRLAVVTYLEK